ncbi:peptide ABC transporter substrate-binding protein [Candidatus Omnitrophota bacterium]
MKRIIYAVIAVLLIATLLIFYLPGAACQPGRQSAPTVNLEGAALNLYGVDPLTLDPAVSGEMTSHNYVMQLFGGLLRLGDDLETAPDIARSWQLSNDGRTYTFYLRQDVMFHNGRQVKAEDFKYSWERACDPSTGSRTAATYLGDIVGVKEVLAGKSREISGARVIDDFTLDVTIDAPKSYFLSKLTYPTSFVVDRANVESGGDWWNRPNGTGPYKLKQWEKEQLLVLERNELYYERAAGVDFVVFYLWSGAPMNMYEMGEIDVTEVGSAYIERITDEAGPFHQELKIMPELSFSYIGFNCAKPPFDDINIRRAFSLAIDKDKLVSLVFKDTVQRADGILPFGMPGHNEDLSGFECDIDQAKELIASSRYGDSSLLPPITITTTGWGGTISSALEAIIHEWRQNLGIEVTVRQLEPELFLYQLKEEKDEMFHIGWVADYPHPQNFVDVLFRTGQDNNFGEYSNPEVDSLLDRAAVEQDRDVSLALYQQVEQLLVDNAACLTLWFGRNHVLVKSYVEGYDLNALGFTRLNLVSIKKH